MNILIINSGSSSIKYKFFSMPKERVLAKGSIEKIGERGSKIKTHQQGLASILKKIKDIDAVGHRVVHGGEKFKQPVRVNSAVINKIKEFSKLAPLHNPPNLEGIYSCKKFLADIPQVAVFDTAFFQTIPNYAFIYGLPYNFYKKHGIRRYGFHGTSHEYVAGEASRKLNKPLSKLNLIICHLGNGCSVAAIKNGRAVDCSLGFTPLEGLVMGTRCGDIDPQIVIYLQREKKIPVKRIDEILNCRSGLKGISGLSNDMRKLLKSKSARAKLSIDIFVYRIRKYIGAYSAVLGKVDAVIFTAGMGENQPRIRNKVCAELFSNLKKIPKILVIPTNEELMIARKTYKVIKNA